MSCSWDFWYWRWRYCCRRCQQARSAVACWRFTGVYLAPSLQAVKVGGLPLVWGMTVFAGLVEIILSRAWSRLRPFIPPESAGLVIFLVGNIIALAALRILLQDSHSGALAGRDEIVCGCALAVMTGLNIWNRGRLRLFCILIGMVIGYLVSGLVGLLSLDDLGSLRDRPLSLSPICPMSPGDSSGRWSCLLRSPAWLRR
jgi:xanthine permease XanP